jgi:DNA-binding response OmpR family regulator
LSSRILLLEDDPAIAGTIDTHVKTLRAKLRTVRPELEPIATHRGMGYSFDLAAH